MKQIDSSKNKKKVPKWRFLEQLKLDTEARNHKTPSTLITMNTLQKQTDEDIAAQLEDCLEKYKDH
jgi:hypothetical protein